MKINNLQPNINNKNNKNISSKGARGVLRTLANPDSLASTIVLESFVTGGRSINAYKRGGFHEFRERFTDDVVSAVFWMKGVDIFNKIGDKFGKHILKLPTTDFDVGKDALRTPFNNVIAAQSKNLSPDKLKSFEKKMAAFKFTKIIMSTLLATGFVGFALPKINQFVTSKLMGKKEPGQEQQKENLDSLFVKKYSLEEFNKNIAQKAKEKPAFKGVSASGLMTTVANCLENNKIAKMLTCDAGILSGRVITARNPDEGAEYFFRDASSSFFYFASTPLTYMLLQKVSKSKNLTSIDPVTAKQIHKVLKAQVKKSPKNTMPVKEFAQKTIGCLDDSAKEIISKIPFKSDVISLSELKKYIPEKLINKAAEMSKLQPKQAQIGKVLTKQQVQDVFKNGALTTSDFMFDIYKNKFGSNLTNEYKFIPMKKITGFRDNIDNYVQSIIDAANKSNNGLVDKKLLNKINRKSFLMSAGFRTLAIGVSAFALGFAIPKLQYILTEKRTGKKGAPGLRQYNSENK